MMQEAEKCLYRPIVTLSKLVATSRALHKEATQGENSGHAAPAACMCQGHHGAGLVGSGNNNKRNFLQNTQENG